MRERVIVPYWNLEGSPWNGWRLVVGYSLEIEHSVAGEGGGSVQRWGMMAGIVSAGNATHNEVDVMKPNKSELREMLVKKLVEFGEPGHPVLEFIAMGGAASSQSGGGEWLSTESARRVVSC